MNFFLEDHPIERKGDYKKGREDCKNGIPHLQERSTPEYDKGYAAQYELDEIKANWTDRAIEDYLENK
jgi:hypothetical protein